MTGGKFLIDVHILVNPETTVTEGHPIAETARRDLIKAMPNIQDVLVQVDGEIDTNLENIYPLARQELIEIAHPIIAKLGNIKFEIRVHYLEEKNIVCVFLAIDLGQNMLNPHKLVSGLKSELDSTPQIDRARVFLDLNSGY